jgi:hypothetical protein
MNVTLADSGKILSGILWHFAAPEVDCTPGLSGLRYVIDCCRTGWGRVMKANRQAVCYASGMRGASSYRIVIAPDTKEIPKICGRRT